MFSRTLCKHALITKQYSLIRFLWLHTAGINIISFSFFNFSNECCYRLIYYCLLLFCYYQLPKSWEDKAFVYPKSTIITTSESSFHILVTERNYSYYYRLLFNKLWIEKRIQVPTTSACFLISHRSRTSTWKQFINFLSYFSPSADAWICAIKGCTCCKKQRGSAWASQKCMFW